MVGPEGRSDGQSDRGRRLKVGLVGLVGASAGLMTLATGAGPIAIVGATLAGLAAGGGLLWYVLRILPSPGRT